MSVLLCHLCKFYCNWKSYFPLSFCNLEHQAITTNLWVFYLIYANLLLTCLRYHLHHPRLTYLLLKILAAYEKEIFQVIIHLCCDENRALLKPGPYSSPTTSLQMKSQREVLKMSLQQEENLNPWGLIYPPYQEWVSAYLISATKREASKSPPKPVRERDKPRLWLIPHNFKTWDVQGKVKHRHPSLS